MAQTTQVVTIQNHDIVQFEHDINRALADLRGFIILDIKYNTLYIGEQTVIHSALIIYEYNDQTPKQIRICTSISFGHVDET